MNPSILWVQGPLNGLPNFVSQLRAKAYLVHTAANGKRAVAQLTAHKPDLAVVNAASLRSSGVRITKTLYQRMDGRPIVVINGGRPNEALSPLVHQELVLPFTVRKLINRIRALCPNADGTLLQAGRVRLLPDYNALCQERNEKSTFSRVKKASD